ncbi:MAG TPA: hypothetical protein VGN14_14335 [Candidatus Elarobacter sp.]
MAELRRLRVCATVEIVVDVTEELDALDSRDVCQLVQNEIGHTGAVVADVVDWHEDEAAR